MDLLAVEWSAAGHATLEAADRIVLWLGIAAASILLLLVVRAVLLRKRYRAVGALTSGEEAAIRSRIGEVEKTTAGELVVVILEESDAHPQAHWLAALLSGLASYMLVAGAGLDEHPSAALAALFGGGALGWILAVVLPGFRRVFVTPGRAEAMAEEQALQEFANLGVHRTEGRTGVLLLVSLFERAVIVLADDGVHRKVGPEAWIEADRKVLEGIRAGSPANGLLAGMDTIAGVLERHCPRKEAERNELPDHLIIRKH
jgi:putative membrane protein